MDDIDDLVKCFENSQWACLPISINFICIYQKNIKKEDLDILKLQKQITKYNHEIAGWKQLTMTILDRNAPSDPIL